MIKRNGFIYIIKNKINDKVYIGQTINSVDVRFKSHLKPSVSKQRRTYKLYNAIILYGRENFYVETLESDVPFEKLNEREIYYIEKYDSYNNGYNSTKGGDGRVINKITDEQNILQLAQHGIHATEIAKIYNVHTETIKRALYKLGFHYVYKKIPKEKILELQETYTDIEIAKYFDVNKATIQRWRKRYGIQKGIGGSSRLIAQREKKRKN